MAAMPEDFTSRSFAPLLGESFQLAPVEGEPLDLVLTECAESDPDPAGEGEQAGHRVPFSLVFHAPDGRLVAQQTGTCRHSALGEFSMFLVPLGPDDEGMGYQAVFG
jgi:hypothetical protein